MEVSALLPIVLMVLWLFLSYLFYFMNCGITQGIMAKASSVNVSTTPLRTSVKVSMQSNVVSFQFLSAFGIRLFEYQGSEAALGDFEMEQIRGWNAIEGAMD